MSDDTEKSILITVRCDHCGAICGFEVLIDRELESDSQLSCTECDWIVARLSLMEVKKGG